MKKKTPKPTIWLVLTALVAFVGAGGMYMQYSSLTAAQVERDKLKKEVKRPYQVQEELDETKRQVEEGQKQLEHLEKSVPAFAYVPTLLKELESFGRAHGLEVFGVRPIPKQESAKDKKAGKQKKQPYVELVIEVKGRGTFKAASEFVTALQTFPKIVAARAVSLKPKNEPGLNSDVLDMTIELKTYLFRPSKDELSALADEFKKSSSQGAGAEIQEPHPSVANGRAPLEAKQGANPNGR
ncbi:MAG: type 4a pilus biogenesis protein PilO [Armatimonadetes bacterium]|nr:type 4a pilus biogenesis protein PilO [Armatimonadota bacterium]